MNRRPWPPHGSVYVIRWHRQGGAPAHRFYFLRWYAERRATLLRYAGYDVELYAAHATWTRLPLPNDRW